MSILERYREKQRQKLAAIELQRMEVEAVAIRCLELKKKAMLSKPCPLINQNCNENCVHFYAGYAFAMKALEGDGFFPRVQSPGCKLWR